MKILASRWLLLAVSLLCVGGISQANDKVTLQLKWVHAFQFAGYYAAIEQGFYEQAGISLVLKEAMPGVDAVDEVLSGRADFGVGNSSLVLAHAKGAPLSILAVIFQHSPQVLITRRELGVTGLQGLLQSKVMLEPHSDELVAMLQRANVDLAQLDIVPHSFNVNDFIDGSVDALSAYDTYETWFLEQAGISYQLFTPRLQGIDFYGDNLFTSSELLQSNPDLVDRFVEASLQGWRYAFEHPESIIQLIRQHYSDKSESFLRYEANRMMDLIQPQMIELGYMSLARWQGIRNTFIELGLISPSYQFGQLIRFPIDKVAQAKLQQTQIISAVSFLALLFVTLTIFFINRKLAKAHIVQQQLSVQQAQSEAKYRCLFEYNPSPSFIWHPEQGIKDCNDAACELFGWPQNELSGKHLIEQVVAEPAKDEWREQLIPLVSQSRVQQGMVDCITKDGQAIICNWYHILLPSKVGLGQHILSIAVDMTEQKKLEQQARTMALFDELTELPNRRLFKQRFSQAIDLSHRTAQYGALIYLDLDDFKQLNDLHGHHAGDQLLCEVASRLNRVLRETDMVARLGGDEFIVMLELLGEERNAAMQQTQFVLDKLQHALHQPYSLNISQQGPSLLYSLTASFGIELFRGKQTSSVELIARADSDMYQNKQNKKRAQ